ncbi:MAG: hypothetical protein RL376_529, partial [Verrucomicrobiota bacterium]
MYRVLLLTLVRALGFLAVCSLTVKAAPETQAVNAAASFTEVSRKEVGLRDHKVTLIRVRAPVSAKVLPRYAPAQAPRPLSKDEQALEDRRTKKTYATLNVTATVY